MRALLRFAFGHIGYAVGLLLFVGAYVLLAPQTWPGFSLDVFDESPSTTAPKSAQNPFTPTISAPTGVIAQVGMPLVAHELLPISQPKPLPPELGLHQRAKVAWLTCARTCHQVPGATTPRYVPRCDARRCDVGKRIRFRDGVFISAPTPAVTPSENVLGSTCEPSRCAAADANLLSRYKPILKLSSGEPWAPTAVEEVIDDYRLTDGRPERLDLAQLSAAADHALSGNLDNVSCRTAAGVSCYGRRLPKYVGDSARVSYGRVWKNPAAPGERDPAFALQYWLFYYFDAFPNNRSFFGSPSAWQLHESDWELVELLLDRKREPLLAAYSQHCAGRLRSWSNVTKRNGHPVVWVALGSHANYFAPTAGTPAPAACSGLGRIPENLITKNKGFLDVADGRGGPLVETRPRPPDKLLNVTGQPRWFFFGGHWGEGNYLRFHLGGGNWRSRRVGDSPESPGVKKEWLNPLLVLRAWPFDR